ncbi:MAG TPA: hypothetical protein VLJ62_13675 [Burkholderiaceae bacterium]|nr:hypothetical protein [Burkholderiaceae bacterium]
MFSPGNFLPGNPVALQRAAATGGASLLRGALNAVDDLQRRVAGRAPAGAEAWRVGTEHVAPWRSVYKPHLLCSSPPGVPPRTGAAKRAYPVLAEAPGHYVLER